MTDVVVVGSLNMDLVARVARAPVAGETVSGESFETFPGGKGANQAVAAARLGAQVAMVGRVGRDPFGRTLVALLAAEGVDVRGVSDDGEGPTGVALIVVERDGGNRIVVVPGANGGLRPGDVEASVRAGLWEGARVLLLQLEVPGETVVRAAEIARGRGMLVLLDPAPAPRRAGGLAPEVARLLKAADAVLPNQLEAEALTGIAVPGPGAAGPAARALRSLGPRTAVVKLGGDGVFVDAEGEIWHEPALAVDVVDTTAAGDAFAGALAARLAAGDGWRRAVAYANRAAALSVTRPGAQPSMPRRHELEG